MKLPVQMAEFDLRQDDSVWLRNNLRGVDPPA
jgi:hypothetical protein